jgi:heterodisulfide reductase subunit A-like polyferredoxin
MSNAGKNTGSPAPVGAVMVVGGGIGGMQASLDLANSGFKVYLVEEQTAIGGKMAQLDKTFPTNDCAMCIVSPKLVEVGRHKNIEILTQTRLESLTGSVGHFRAQLTGGPRFVLVDKCTGCGECVDKCPVEIRDEYNLGMSARRAIYKQYAQAIPGAYAIDKAGRAPCKEGCPAHISVQGYVALIAAGRFAEALALIRRNNPFPSVCGRVCTHPCEQACSRAQVDEPVAIRELKRFAADYELRHGPPRLPEPGADREERVAVVGGGPSGLTAAYFLRLSGYRVTVFEAMPRPGGMLRYGIPAYRLPRDVLDREIKGILDLGISVRTNQRFMRDFTIDMLKSEGYRAVYLATGAWANARMQVPGDDLEGVLVGTEFLAGAQLGRPTPVGEKVVVVGGGNTAVDAARTALRLGALEVTILYRRSRKEMPALAHEVEAAEEEGVRVHLLAAPTRCRGENGKLTRLEYIGMELGEPDRSGRRRPVPIQGSETVLRVDTLIVAIGQRAELDWLPEAERRRSASSDRRGWLVFDPVTFETVLPGVFAGGDLATGPATAIEAIAAGREAAVSIDRYLSGGDLRAGRPSNPPVARVRTEDLKKEPRRRPEMLDPEVRKNSQEEVEQCLTEEQAVAEARRCLSCGVCCECYQCVEACAAGAIDHRQVATTREVDVGSLILAPGFEVIPPQVRPEFGYGRCQNVITSIEFERLLSASGPTEGHVRRPSDGAAPRRIAWIQCVGSRDHSCNRDYCSSVCCMYATKEALIAREHDERIESTIFYIDLRAFGKGFDEYVERAREHHGVRYVRAMVSRVFEDPITGNLELRYVDESGRRIDAEFDLVVLSVGLQISAEVRDLARRLDVDLDEFGFARTKALRPLVSSRPGVFVCGVFNEPKDIPETVSEASGAAGEAATDLSVSRGSLVVEEVLPPERSIPEDDPLRIGVFVCHCGINIAAIVDVVAVTEYARSLPGVVYADHVLYTCSQDSQEKMREIILEQGLNRVVVASCSPRTHEPLFMQTLSQVGLNKYFFDMANIRDQCSWVHRLDHRRATEKAKRLVRMTVANVSWARPLQEREFEVNPGLLVIGGGLAGMTAALVAARQGFEVFLVEKEAELGGNLKNLRRTSRGDSVGDFLRKLVGEVIEHHKIRVFAASQVVEHSGYVGNFETEIMTPAGGSRILKHGAVLVATGGKEARPSIFGLSEHENVWTQTEFEQRLYDRLGLGLRFSHVVMIQCAGSRGDPLPYCSRVCCNQAIKNALAFKRRFHDARVDILYRDIRSYGLGEIQYRAARLAGVNFIRYDPETNPLRVDTGREGIEVALTDSSIRRRVELRPDLLVLSTGVTADDVEELGIMLHAQRDDNGFFMEAHAKLRPVDVAGEGLFLAGMAHGPKSIPETIAQASAAVARAATILSRRKLRASGIVSRVDPEKCAVCLTCVRACPYTVPFINEEHTAEINPAMCQGCGICAAECPAKAITLGHYSDLQLVAKLSALERMEVV